MEKQPHIIIEIQSKIDKYETVLKSIDKNIYYGTHNKISGIIEGYKDSLKLIKGIN